jgi:tRNA(Ile)-lysidine synthase
MDLEPLVRADGLLARGRPVVVLYSGGRDSTCLLDVAVRIAGPESVTALHVNYGLRESADDDQRHCEVLCDRLGVELSVTMVGGRTRPGSDARGRGAPAGAAGGNLQAWAREVRYAAADELAAVRGAEVAAGHTATDQVETILYRLASSPSRRALLGMAPRDDARTPVLIRPLLGVTRASTAAHCEARGLAWRDDETNATGAYARGRVRHGLVPALRAIHPAAEANVLAVAQTLREEGAVLDALVNEILGGRAQVELERLRALAPALRRLVVQRLADAAVGGPAAGVGRRADEVAAMRATGTCALDLPSGVRATARRGVVTFSRTPALRSMAEPSASPQRLNTLPK